jgi:hypothetical protein
LKSALGYSSDATTLFLAEVDVVTASVAIFPGEKYVGSFERDGVLLILSDNDFMPHTDVKRILIPYNYIGSISTQDSSNGVRITRNPADYSHLVVEQLDGLAIKMSLLRHTDRNSNWLSENLLLIQHVVDTHQLPLAGFKQQAKPTVRPDPMVQSVCPNCGNKIETHQKFCTRCGTKLS